jgi:hypothetical protein
MVWGERPNGGVKKTRLATWDISPFLSSMTALVPLRSGYQSFTFLHGVTREEDLVGQLTSTVSFPPGAEPSQSFERVSVPLTIR